MGISLLIQQSQQEQSMKSFLLIIVAIGILSNGLNGKPSNLQEHSKISQLLRVPRKNSRFFEELQIAHYERECVEEMRDFEELDEVFDGDSATVKARWNEMNKQCFIRGCYWEGTEGCENIWRNRICHCKPGFRGEDCSEVFDDGYATKMYRRN